MGFWFALALPGFISGAIIGALPDHIDHTVLIIFYSILPLIIGYALVPSKESKEEGLLDLVFNGFGLFGHILFTFGFMFGLFVGQGGDEPKFLAIMILDNDIGWLSVPLTFFIVAPVCFFLGVFLGGVIKPKLIKN